MLLVAVVKNNIHVVNALLKAKVNTEFRGDYFATPLYLAADRSYTSMVEQLLNHLEFNCFNRLYQGGRKF